MPSHGFPALSKTATADPLEYTPILVCKVAFVEWTDAGHLRHCTFVAMRDDKNLLRRFAKLEMIRIGTSALEINRESTRMTSLVARKRGREWLQAKRIAALR